MGDGAIDPPTWFVFAGSVIAVTIVAKVVVHAFTTGWVADVIIGGLVGGWLLVAARWVIARADRRGT